MDHCRLHTRLLLQAGKLLLEYNESSEAIVQALTSTARKLTDVRCQVVVFYRGVAVSFTGDCPILETVHELRYNASVQVRLHEILDELRRGELDAAAALTRLKRVEAETPRHSRWLVALLLGAAAASLARLLGADLGAVVVSGFAAIFGVIARQELGRRHASLLALPLAASFIGALSGGIAIQLDWTQSPELVLIVPALMVVPGPHLINGLFDLIDNHIPMCLSRLGLATGILMASALGIVLGVELTIPVPYSLERTVNVPALNLAFDMVLAGIATCGFAAFYNVGWRNLWLSAIIGMTGHGLRFLAGEMGLQLQTATFLGGLAVGALSAWVARARKAPVAVIAFAGAVTMIPGSTLYRALAGVLQLARATDSGNPSLAAMTLGNAFQGFVVVSGLVLGLVIGIRAVMLLSHNRTHR